jgi:hypothetical protein
MERLKPQVLLKELDAVVKYKRAPRWYLWDFNPGTTAPCAARFERAIHSDQFSKKFAQSAMRVILRLRAQGLEKKRGAKHGRAAKYHLDEIAPDVLRDYDRPQPAFKGGVGRETAS